MWVFIFSQRWLLIIYPQASVCNKHLIFYMDPDVSKNVFPPFSGPKSGGWEFCRVISSCCQQHGGLVIASINQPIPRKANFNCENGINTSFRNFSIRLEDYTWRHNPEKQNVKMSHFRFIVELFVRSGPIRAQLLCRCCLLALCTSHRNDTSRGSRPHLSLMTRRDVSSWLSFHQIYACLIFVLILSPQSRWNLIQWNLQ
jgi:hypothetical protein